MPRHASPLTAKGIIAKRLKPGRHADGNNLHLLVKPSGARSWVFRFAFGGKRHDLGLGPAPESEDDKAAVSLAEARDMATTLCRQVRAGINPAVVRRDERTARQAAAKTAAARTFRDVAKLYVAAHEAGWRNTKHVAQWTSTLETYAYPHFGDLLVAEVNTGHVMDALRPIWHNKPETASRLRGRIEAVLDYATPLEWRSGPNPARWKGHLASMLPSRSKVATVEHHAALPWQQIGAFLADLRQIASVSAFGLEFAILTAARTGEVLGARWSEIDLQAKLWTIPGARMKAKREHRVPLTPAALAVLTKAQELRKTSGPDAFVFPGQKGENSGLSQMTLAMLLRRMGREDITVHGFRSTFRDWASEATSFDRDTAEAALAHTVKDKVEAAYRRGDQLEKRRRMMEAWADHCAKPMQADGGNVVAIRAAGAGGVA
ncbi:MAG: tyrosine-type recombinase/integrase [Acetobacteraceae bacterium]|nr:tyrosine-type recombinase/integrase [Acetobacteraceae bacterium]